jgi:predicted Zn-dependent protease
MGHEIAHAIASHGAERMSQGLLQQLGGVALSVALKDKPEETRALWLTAYGVGTTVGVMLPYSRSHESEADHLGLIFMAMAGYDPKEAPKFWERFAKAGGSQPPEFLSTHPSHQTRIEDLNEWMPEALKYYKK